MAKHASASFCKSALKARAWSQNQRNRFKTPVHPDVCSYKRLEKDETDHDSLDEKEKGIELMITFVSCDGSRHHATEIEDTADDIWCS